MQISLTAEQEREETGTVSTVAELRQTRLTDDLIPDGSVVVYYRSCNNFLLFVLSISVTMRIV